MAKALADVMPETRHGLCMWHLLQNGVKDLGSLMKGGSFLLLRLKLILREKSLTWSMVIIFVIKLGSFQLMSLRKNGMHVL